MESMLYILYTYKEVIFSVVIKVKAERSTTWVSQVRTEG